MKLHAYASLLMLTAGVALADGEPPLVRKVIPSNAKQVTHALAPSKASGKVITLPATSLPPGAIVPSAQSLAPPQPPKPSNGLLHFDAGKPAPATAAVFVLTDPNLRWQFYSYP